MIGIGTDIVELDRIKQSVEKHGERFLNYVYTEKERAFLKGGANDINFLAGRWAAKESIYKVLSAKIELGIAWQDMEVLRGESGAPEVFLSGKALLRSKELGIKKVHISISHCRSYAVAYAIGE